MKKAICALVCFCCFFMGLSAVGSGQHALGNEDVAKMVKAGLSRQTIISTIKANPASFSLTQEAVNELKNAGVSEDIIAAMFVVSSTSSKAEIDSNLPKEIGIFLQRDDQFAQIDGRTITKYRGGFLKSLATVGFAASKTKAEIPGRNAPTRLKTSSPVFYIHLDRRQDIYAFSLVELDQKEKARQIEVASTSNTSGVTYGVPDKYRREIVLEKVALGYYKVSPKEELEPGEYGFFLFPGGANTAVAKIWDFGIDK